MVDFADHGLTYSPAEISEIRDRYPEGWRNAKSATEVILSALIHSESKAEDTLAGLEADNPDWQDSIDDLRQTILGLPRAKSAINDLSEESGVRGASDFLIRHDVEVLFADAKAGADHIDVWGVREINGELILVTLEAKGGDKFSLGGKWIRDGGGRGRGVWYTRQSSGPYVLDEAARDKNLPRILNAKAAEYELSDPQRAKMFKTLVRQVENLGTAIDSHITTGRFDGRMDLPTIEHGIYKVDSEGRGFL